MDSGTIHTGIQDFAGNLFANPTFKAPASLYFKYVGVQKRLKVKWWSVPF